MPKETIALAGYVARLRKARQEHRCKICPWPILQGYEYYSITIGGGGLGSLKDPWRTHVECLSTFFYQKEHREQTAEK